jgi:serine/threonine-protein phosphatase PGAM5
LKSWPDPLDLHRDAPRIEAAFCKYVHRSPPIDKGAEENENKDEYEIFAIHGELKTRRVLVLDFCFERFLPLAVVAAGNVIRFFVCRALQLPPSAWLRFATYNCGITHIIIRPNGNCSLYGFGDTGHLDKVTYH